MFSLEAETTNVYFMLLFFEQLYVKIRYTLID